MRYIPLLLLCGSLCLSSCATPIAVGSAVGGSVCSVVANDRRNISTISADKNIYYQAGLRLKSESGLKDCRIVPAAFNRIILLVGEAPTEAQRQLAEQVVAGIPDVKHIYNKIEISQPISTKTQSYDAWITTKVITKMVGCADLNVTHIKVVTEDGTVYLMGIVTAHQAYAAGEVTRQVEGVKRVVTLFEYT